MKNFPMYISLPQYLYYSVSGDKALSFLQGQLSCDVTLVNETQGVFGAYLNIKGRVVSTVRVLKFDNQLLLQLPDSLAESVISRLERIARLSRVTFTAEPKLSTLGMIGQDSTLTETLPLKPMSLTYLQPDLGLLRIGSSELFMLIGSKEQISRWMPSAVIEDKNVWLYHLIQTRLVEVDAATTEEFTVHDLDLPAHQAVSFTKGCYLGQEIVARMQYLGKLKQHLQYLQWEQPPHRANNTPLSDQNQQIVGHIVMVCTIENQQYALAVVKDGAFQ